MARPRAFDEAVVVDAAGACFTRLGYAATSVDDLVAATGLHRGSLYSAFGSKRGLFLAAFARHLPPGAAADTGPTPTALDLLLVAALELAPHDDHVRSLVDGACRALPGDAATVLGQRLLRRAALTPTTGQSTDPHPRRSA